MNKIVGLEESAEGIGAGALLAMTTSLIDNAPLAFVRQLIRNSARGLKLATLTGGGLNADLLIGAGLVSEYETCFCMLGDFGPAPNFQRAIRTPGFVLKDNT